MYHRFAARILVCAIAQVIVSLLLLVPHAVRAAQVPPGQVKELRVVLAGNALFSRVTQEAVMLAVPWRQMVAEFFPRRNVSVMVEYDRGDRPPNVLTEDAAREQSFDPERARTLLGKSGFDSRYKQVRLQLLCHPDICHAMNWLVPFLDKVGLAPFKYVEAKELRQPVNEPAVLWVTVR